MALKSGGNRSRAIHMGLFFLGILSACSDELVELRDDEKRVSPLSLMCTVAK